MFITIVLWSQKKRMLVKTTESSEQNFERVL